MVLKLIGDLSVDTGNGFWAMNEKVESWDHTDKAFDPEAEEEGMDNRLVEEIYELERDQRTDQHYFEAVGPDEGIFGCMGLLGCLQDQLGILRRKMGRSAIKQLFQRKA